MLIVWHDICIVAIIVIVVGMVYALAYSVPTYSLLNLSTKYISLSSLIRSVLMPVLYTRTVL